MRGGFKEVEDEYSSLATKYNAPSSAWLELIETELGVDGRKFLLTMLQAHANNRGTGDVGPSLQAADGENLTHRRVIPRTLHTMFGDITIERMGYSHRYHDALFPLDALMNLPISSFSAGLQKFIASRIAKTPFSDVLQQLKELTGVSVAPPQAIEIAQQCAVDFTAFYAEKEGEKSDGYHPILVLTTDGKGVVMRPDGLREETRERAEKAKPAMKKRLAPGEKANRKRMAQVASVYFIKRFPRNSEDIINELAHVEAQKHRPRPNRKRVWASLEDDADVVIKAMFAEAHKRDPKHRREWVILVDGAKHQLRVVRSLAQKEGVNATIILDIMHVIEYLWNAARAFLADKDHRGCERWVEDQLQRILDGDAGKVAGTVRLQVAKRKLEEAKAKAATACADYISRRKAYMRYDLFLKRGYPIASGAIEGACRHLIKDRMDVTGARWTLGGAEAVLKLRSLVSSGDFEDYWAFHRRQEHERSHLSCFDDPKQLAPKQQSQISDKKSEETPRKPGGRSKGRGR